jgi:predicted dehydrogenase
VWSIDLLRWLTGSDFVEVHATTKYTQLEQFGGTLGYDAFAAVRLSNGVVGSLQYSGSVNDAATTSVLEVVGDSTCVLNASNNDIVTLLGESPAKTEWNVKQRGPGMWGHQQQNEHLIQCLLGGRQPDITPEDGRKAIEIALEIAKAS